MKDRPATVKKHRPPWILGAFVLILLTLLVLLQSSNLWKDFAVDSASDTLLLYALSSLNFFAFVIFGFIFLRNLIKLARERRALALGSKIKTRLWLYFLAISILPIIAMAGFSYLFMNRAIERWFTQIPEDVVRKTREVQDQTISELNLKISETAAMLASSLDGRPVRPDDLRKIAEAGNLTRIEILSAGNEPIVFYERPLEADQREELARVMESVRRGPVDAQFLRDGKGFDAAAVTFSGDRRLIIVPDRFEKENVGELVDNSLAEFDRLKERQITVRQIGLLTLGVLTFLLIFASSWTALYIARGLTVPIKALAEGADEIAQGNLGHRVEVLAEDELALLVASFNQMSAKLEENSAELEERRRYIETVLQALSTGVISLDAENRVTTINKAAKHIFKLEDVDFTDCELSRLVSEENRVVLEKLVSRAKRTGQASEQTVLQREPADPPNGSGSGSLPVALTATALPGGFGQASGVVLVIEDLSELIAAQRASAWAEVARRMAHEIKNPLTPIQLSAERIAKRFAMLAGKEDARNFDQAVKETFEKKEKPGTDEKEAAKYRAGQLDQTASQKDQRGTNNEQLTNDKGQTANEQLAKIVSESTATILREVNSLKSMVDEFSRFARLPNVKLENGDLNKVVRRSAALYEDRFADVSIELNLAEKLPNSLLDGEQLKRVFVNLIENAIEAFDPGQVDKRITLKTFYDRGRDLIVAEVADNASGIRPADFQKLFQPYFSTKGRGTGLGLAIVQRIVSEHHGRIKAVNNTPRGARFIVELPAAV